MFKEKNKIYLIFMINSSIYRRVSFIFFVLLSIVQTKVLILYVLKRSVFRLARSRLIKFAFFGGPVIDRATTVSYSTEHMQHDYRINTHTHTRLATRGNFCVSLSFLCFSSHNRRHSRNTIIHRQSIITCMYFLFSFHLTIMTYWKQLDSQ
jgi:hypothetical protein